MTFLMEWYIKQPQSTYSSLPPSSKTRTPSQRGCTTPLRSSSLHHTSPNIATTTNATCNKSLLLCARACLAHMSASACVNACFQFFRFQALRCSSRPFAFSIFCLPGLLVRGKKKLADPTSKGDQFYCVEEKGWSAFTNAEVELFYP